MTPLMALLKRLREEGVFLSVVGGSGLSLKMPPAGISADLKAQVHANKQGLLAFLKQAESRVPAGAQGLTSVLDSLADGLGPPLFLVPGVGGSTKCFRSLAVPQGWSGPLYGLRSPGFCGEVLPGSMPLLAQRLCQLLAAEKLPDEYYLGGHSMGGLVALLMAPILAAMGKPPTCLLLLDTFPPDVKDGGAHKRQVLIQLLLVELELALGRVPKRSAALALLSDLELVAHFSQRNHWEEEDSVWDAALAADTVRVVVANHQNYYTYQPCHYAGAVVLVEGANPGWPPASQFWSDVLPNLEIFPVAANHVQLLNARVEELLPILKSKLRRR